MKSKSPAQAPIARSRNIVISGTNFWNPGDDFVRDGVIRVLQEVFAGETLNFLFYNFNADFFPQDKFAGTGNYLSKGDLEKYRDFVDAVVIAGLSAGDEIKDLYRWIVANGLEEKVLLIGAGYENNYVAQHVSQEPEATIFRKARLILGRTEKTPAFIQAAGTPYFHVNCPAMLSVPEVKKIAPGQTVQRIGFSIQLPHGVGVVNHCCGREQYELGVAVLRDLARNHAVEVVAHHKTEYFHFLNLLRGENIPVVFSSFYQDLHQIYPRYDLVVTTRLHASLFANGHGIPGIILNDTDRHTHALEGFLHSDRANDRAGFQKAFEKVCRCNLADVAREAQAFKRELLAQYVALVGKAAGSETRAAGYAFDSEKKEQALVRSLVTPGMVAFDVGANIGKYTKLFSLLVGERGKVFAFEPDPRSAERVQKLAAKDGLANVRVINQAVAECAGTVILNQFPEEYCSWNSLGRPHMEDPRNPRQFVPIVSSVAVEAVTLDEFCAAQGIEQIDYLKLDVEGAEFRALQGARGLLQRQAIRFLQFEVSLKMLEGLDTCAKPVFDLLASLGYDCHAISKDGEMLGVVSDSQEFYENYIAVPNPAAGLSEAFFSNLLGALQQPANKQRVLDILAKLEQDGSREQSLTRYQDAGAWFDTATLLNWIARTVKPKNYLEIGVSHGRSMAQVLVESPATQAFGFGRGEFVPGELSKLGVARLPKLVRGDSPETVLAFFKDLANPQSFELILVDGEHTGDGARAELEIAFARLAPGGALIFGDICNAAHAGLPAVWNEFSERHPDYLFINDHTGAGTGVAFRPPFDRLRAAVETVEGAAPGAAKPDEMLPVHFFTIVLNGQPFIRHHIDAFKQLPFAWHWHIVEGVAELNHDTGWSKASGGKIPDGMHRAGLSVDGTTEYLDALKKEFPQNITIYRPPAGKFWDGKRAMVNAPLANIAQNCLLWQVDADELWTAAQIAGTRALFLACPDKTAALFYCEYFVGPKLVTTTRDTYGNYASEWLRVWRYQPGDRWLAHEPPRLCRGDRDVAGINPMRHAETEAHGLVFQHYAYATEAQIQFKEFYYGYAGAAGRWQQLQQAGDFPVRLADYFPWVQDEAMVNTTEARGIRRLAPGEWFAAADGTPMATHPLAGAERILFVRTDAIGDAVLASAMLEPLRLAHPEAKLAVLCQMHVAELFTACPFVDSVICFDRKKMDVPAEREQIIAEIAAFQPDVILNSTRSRDRFSDELTLAFTSAKHIAIECDLDNISEGDREKFGARYDLLFPSPGAHKPELERHADFLRGLGIEASELQPVVWTSPEDEATATAFMQAQELDPSLTIAVFPGAQNQMRIYGRYAEALKALDGFTFLIFGDASQNHLAIALERQLPGRTVNLCGRTTLREMAALLRQCRLYVGAESAGAHIACAVGLPNVVLLGGGHFGRFMPYSALTSAVVLPLNCFGCIWHCKYSTALCVHSVEPYVLAQSIAATLQDEGARPRVFAQVDPSGLPAAQSTLAAWLPVETLEIIPVNAGQPVPNCWPSFQYGRGVHKEEPGFRWLDTEAEVEVLVPADGGSALMTCELQAASMLAYARIPLKVSVFVNGQLNQELVFQTDNQIERISLNLPPAAQPYRLRFNSSQFFTSSGDDRRLAVRLQKVELVPGKDNSSPSTEPLIPKHSYIDNPKHLHAKQFSF